jgi:hypothetical protein
MMLDATKCCFKIEKQFIKATKTAQIAHNDGPKARRAINKAARRACRVY